MLTIQSAHSPSYSAADNSIITLQVKFAEFEEELPFGATPYDVMPYGVELYNRALTGEFGEIQAFQDPSIATEPQPVTTGAQTL